jgi:putative DNA primase/helicase
MDAHTNSAITAFCLLRAFNLAKDDSEKFEAIRQATAHTYSGELDEFEAQDERDRISDLSIHVEELDADAVQVAMAAGTAEGEKGKKARDAENIDLDRRALQAKLPAAKLKPYDISDFLALEIPPRGMVLDPIIPEKGTAMLFAARGNGKTHVAHGIAFAVAAGGQFLKWTAPKPRRVLVVDGEMPASELQKRLRDVLWSVSAQPQPGMLNLLAADLVEGGIGNLADPKAQAILDPHLEGVEILVLDNLSCLTTVIKDNDAESWGPIQEWLLRLRRRGVSVLIVHHAGKGGTQRGTSRREDVLDTSISLRRPDDYVPTEGARFEVHIEKGRGIHGEDAKPFEARLQARDGMAEWTVRELEDAKLARVLALHADELSVREIAEETGIPKSTVDRMIKRSAAA